MSAFLAVNEVIIYNSLQELQNESFCLCQIVAQSCDDFSLELLKRRNRTVSLVFLPPVSMVLSSSMRQVSVSVVNRQPIGSKGWPTQPSRLVVEVTPLWRSSERGRQNVKMIHPDSTLAPENKYFKFVCVCFTFLLVFVDVHLSLLLEAERVDDGDGQSQGFPGVTVGTQGVDTSACRRDVVCVVDREIRWSQDSFTHTHTHTLCYAQ